MRLTTTFLLSAVLAVPLAGGAAFAPALAATAAPAPSVSQQATPSSPDSATPSGADALTTTPAPIPLTVQATGTTTLDSVAAGSPVTLTVGGMATGSSVAITLDGSTTPLATATADHDGAARPVVTMPAGLTAGPHTLVLAGTDVNGQKTTTKVPVTAINPGGRKIYVDCSASASGDGSKDAPIATIDDLNAMTFGPGDEILFKSGTTCTGMFTPTGSGQFGKPIMATTYGGDALATINGAGAANAVLLKDVSYWTLNKLHLTNPATDRARRTGVQVESSSPDAKTSITLSHLTIDNTAGWGSKTVQTADYNFSAGIIFMMDQNAGPFDQVSITDNDLSDTGGGGIKITGVDNPTKNTHVYLARNMIERPGGDAIVIHNSEAPLAEYNTALDLGQGAYPFTGGNFAGMWSYASNDATFQYNVVGNSMGVVYDATAWDCDNLDTGTCLFQYNYSFGNAGGFFLDCLGGCGGGTSTQIILRYNIAQDDCRISGGHSGPATQIYNNTFYCASRQFEDDMTAPRTMQNNIFVAKTGTFRETSPDYTYTANTYYGGITPPTSDPKAMTSDPGLQAPGSGQATLNVPGYRLLNTSSQIGTGVVVPDNGGTDFFGNAVSSTEAPNRGADNGAGVSAKPLPVSALYDQTALASIGNPRNGAITLDRQTMSAEALADAGLSAGTKVTALGATFTFHPEAVGRADNIKAAGQDVAIGKHADSLVFLGFSSQGVDSGDVTVHYANGRTQTATLHLSDWHSTTAQGGDQLVASGATSLIHHGSYNDGTVATQDTASSVFADSIPLTENSKVVSVTLPAGTVFADPGLHIFDVQAVSNPQPPTPTPTPSTPAGTVTPAPAAGGGTLPNTGASVLGLVLTAAMALAVGGVALVTRRRAQRQR